MKISQGLLKCLKGAFDKSSLASNGAFALALTVLEKVLELEFECPCSPTWNGLFSSAFFIIPAVITFTLMLIIQGYKYEEKKKNKDKDKNKKKKKGCRRDTWCKPTSIISSCVPAILWLILLFLDGQYFACAMTYWNGTFVQLDKADWQKWCEPVSETNDTNKHFMRRSKQFFVISQVIGIALLIFACVVLVLFVIIKCSQPEKESKNKVEDIEMTVLSAVTTEPAVVSDASETSPRQPGGQCTTAPPVPNYISVHYSPMQPTGCAGN